VKKKSRFLILLIFVISIFSALQKTKGTEDSKKREGQKSILNQSKEETEQQKFSQKQQPHPLPKQLTKEEQEHIWQQMNAGGDRDFMPHTWEKK